MTEVRELSDLPLNLSSIGDQIDNEQHDSSGSRARGLRKGGGQNPNFLDESRPPRLLISSSAQRSTQQFHPKLHKLYTVFMSSV